MSDIHQMTTPLGEIALGDAMSYIDRLRAEVYRARSERVALQARVAELEEQYGELIFAVATKYPDETRHQTALRYIQQAENREASPACELKP